MTSTPAPGNEQPRLTVIDGWQSLAPLAPGQPTPTTNTPLTRTQQILIGIVTFAVVVIAFLGFVGSYDAVTKLAEQKHFGDFAQAFPIAVDAGIIAFLALDLLLTWLRMPFPLLRQGAWGLTGATIAFNAATAWPDALGVGMHAVIPALFVLAVEAARHAVGRIADITADRHIESPPVIRWVLDPYGTFRIWRRQRMWQLKSYEDVIAIERDAAKYRQKLSSVHGRKWRSKAEAHQILALRYARYGTPVGDTLAEHEAELAAANSRQEQRQDDTATGRQNAPAAATTGGADSATDNDSKRQNGRQDERQIPRQDTATGATDSNANTDKNADGATSGAAKKKPAKAAKKATASASTRRPMAEWVELAGPVFHRQFHELRRQPTAKEFADAIANENLGSVSDSTAKNIRQAVLDNEPLPVL
ncbi:DUF2637 domain-containing protein [Streptomyces sp. NPDC006641]|uniref:DUF2637 domain-containing protein n=1 Tax=unclassified Streptomyces TaxID=2593676 RepID=UPI0036A04680